MTLMVNGDVKYVNTEFYLWLLLYATRWPRRIKTNLVEVPKLDTIPVSGDAKTTILFVLLVVMPQLPFFPS